MIREVLKHKVYYRSHASAGSLMPSTSTSMSRIRQLDKRLKTNKTNKTRHIIIGGITITTIINALSFAPTFAATHSLSMTTSGTVSVDVSTTGNGTAVGQDNLTIISTCPNGYTVTIKGPNDTNLYKDGNTANNATNTKITPSVGTISNPLPITDNTSNGGANYRGTWGYSLTSSTGTSNFIGLTSTTTTLITKATASGDGNIVGNGTSTGTTDIIPIYYGVSTTLDQAPGLYTMSSTNNGNGAIAYFITTPESCTSYTVAYNPTSTANSTTLSGTGTMPNQTISEDTATNLNSNTFTAPTGYSFNGWNTKQDGTGTHYANNASVTNLIPAGQTITLYAEWTPNSYTCTKRYRLQNADGTFPSAYTADTTEQVPYNTTCTYTKSATDYKGTSNGTNNTQASTSHLMDSTNGITLSLDLYRNTYTLTVSAGTNTSNPTGSGTYRWGQVVSVGVTKATNVTCTTYATPTWTQTGTAGTFSSTSGTSTNFSMGKGNATVTAKSTASNVEQTITLSRGTGVSSIRINGINLTGSSVSLTCGTYNISGGYSTGYTFSSWSRANGVAVSSTSSSSTTMTVTGAGALTLNGKAATYNLVITADSHTSAFSVRAGSTSGTSTSCSKSSNTFTCSNLTYGTNYYLYPTFASGYEFNSYQKTDSATNASLGSTSSVNTYYKMGAGNGAITMTSKQSCSSTLSGVMQNFVPCSSIADGATGTMTDNRSGNKTYTVAKIGNLIWMTRNLDLPGGTTLTSANSNVTSSYTLPTSSTSGFSSDSTAYVYNSNSTTCGNQPCYSYYSYVAATAGTNPSSGNATSDICPKGWRLPTQAEYNTLIGTYATGAALAASPFYGIYASYYYNNRFYSAGRGWYWSSTAYNTSNAYYLNFDSLVSADNTYYGYKRFGYPIRCVAKS